MRLAVTGRSDGRGAKPQWLREALDFTVTGLGPGSTTIGIEAPRLGDVAGLHLDQPDLWLQQPDAGDTALDLGARATQEAQASAASGDYFDGNVLKAILGLGAASRVEEARYELIAERRSGTGFVLRATACPMIRDRLHLIPNPGAFVVSGRLDLIGHGTGRFRLLMGDSFLPGRLDRNRLDVELLRPLWGMPATVQGIVHFKSDGRPRLIEAHRISARTEGDRMFETMPRARVQGRGRAGLKEVRQGRSGSALSEPSSRHMDPMALWGAWPGDEPIEELLAALD